MKKNKIFSLIFILMIALSGCKAKKHDMSDKVNIVTTIFPEYDWVRNIISGDNPFTTLTLLVKNGMDLHSFQPSAADMINISTCDLFIYVGGESDSWVKEAIANATNKNMICINLMDLLKEQVKVEDDSFIAQKEEENADDEDALEYDEHVWLSVKNVKIICKAITDAVCKLDSEHADQYTRNYETYLTKLNQLDADYTLIIENAKRNVLIVCDRFPFRYLADDYNLNYYAAFAGCSAETEASFETVAFLASKIDELNPGAVLTIETSDQKLAKTVVMNSHQKFTDILQLDSLQSTTLRQAFDGKTYIKTMRKNLEILNKCLN